MCDMPQQTLQMMFEYIRDTVKPDILVWTGDNTNHAIWDSNVEEVLMSTTNITLMMTQVFKNTKITVIPINGNHDFFPANDQDMSLGPNNNSYINEYATQWNEAGWLTDNETKVFKQYGYYSKNLTLKDGRVFTNTKVIALNTLACYQFNFNIINSRYDPGNQIDWLTAEL